MSALALTWPDKLHNVAAHRALVRADGCSFAKRMIATTAPLVTAWSRDAS